MSKFLESYIETALWSSTDDKGTPFDNSEYANTELAEETRAAMLKDCEAFEPAADTLINEYAIANNYNQAQTREQIAHDFWLTRNHHGTGFWDSDYPKTLGEQLTKLAHSFPEVDLYFGDDGKIYQA